MKVSRFSILDRLLTRAAQHPLPTYDRQGAAHVKRALQTTASFLDRLLTRAAQQPFPNHDRQGVAHVKRYIALLALLSLSCAFAQQEKETIRQTFPTAARVEVDNVHGSIHVTGYNGSEIQLVAEKTIDADSQDKLDTAKRDVKLDITRSGEALKMFVDGQFRCHCGDGGFGVHEHGRPGYTVNYDFELKVPAATILQLATVNHGQIRIENTTGDFDLGNVNGGIELTEVAGSGLVHTVNGKITALFARNPTGSSSFKTVNGGIEASFRPNLSADVHVKTFNGSAYTDFAVTSLPRTAATPERRDGKFIYRASNFTGMRIGNGGPEFKFDTLNGSIRIINRGQ